jgi:F-type H+-transporting ATPase subunit a
MCAMLFTPAAMASEAETHENTFNPVSFLFGHVGDGYEFHITEINGHPISVPLLIIAHSEERGWFVFSSSHLAHGHEYQNFYIANGGTYDGKLVERNSQGEEVRPFDLSITKNVFAILLSSAILLGIFIPMAQAYKKRPLGVPSKGHSLMEVVINTPAIKLYILGM